MVSFYHFLWTEPISCAEPQPPRSYNKGGSPLELEPGSLTPNPALFHPAQLPGGSCMSRPQKRRVRKKDVSGTGFFLTASDSVTMTSSHLGRPQAISLPACLIPNIWKCTHIIIFIHFTNLMLIFSC